MAAKTKNQKLVSSEIYKHNGNMLAEYFTEHSVNRAALARQLGVAPTTILKYLKSESLQFRILWNISIALNYNFIAELSKELPIEIPDPPKDERLIALEKELERVNIELSVYKNILDKKS